MHNSTSQVNIDYTGFSQTYYTRAHNKIKKMATDTVNIAQRFIAVS